MQWKSFWGGGIKNFISNYYKVINYKSHHKSLKQKLFYYIYFYYLSWMSPSSSYPKSHIIKKAVIIIQIPWKSILELFQSNTQSMLDQNISSICQYYVPELMIYAWFHREIMFNINIIKDIKKAIWLVFYLHVQRSWDVEM